jgi:hypothetical protein
MHRTDPPEGYGPYPFWFLNDDLNDVELGRQLADFHARGVDGVVLHPRLGLPRDLAFMSDKWLDRVRFCVDEAARLGMGVILYDEGMYPSGSCAGEVVARDARFASRALVRRETAELGPLEELVYQSEGFQYVHVPSGGVIRGVHYEADGRENRPPSGDLLNPDSVAAFIELVHERYWQRLHDHFGATVKAVFTDEPNVLGRGPNRGTFKPWTWGFLDHINAYTGRDFAPFLPALFDGSHPDHAEADRLFRAAVNDRLEKTFYRNISDWCASRGIALTGHPSQPGDIGTLRYFHIPGQDIVWRHIEPYEENAIEGDASTMAKCALSAQLHHGRRRNGNECFGAYGHEFTEDEMWWLTNWLFVRGTNLIMPHAFYYSIRGPRKEERPPDVGPNSPWWPRYRTYANYCRRMCCLLAEGELVCGAAILGTAEFLPWEAARVLFEAQRDFVYIDADTLLNAADIQPDGLHLAGRTYKTLIVDNGAGAVECGDSDVLQSLADAGRLIAYGARTAGQAPVDNSGVLDALDALVPPALVLDASEPGLRHLHLRDAADVRRNWHIFANEQRTPINARMTLAAHGGGLWWDPAKGAADPEAAPDYVRLEPGQLKVLFVGPDASDARQFPQPISEKAATDRAVLW